MVKWRNGGEREEAGVGGGGEEDLGDHATVASRWSSDGGRSWWPNGVPSQPPYDGFLLFFIFFAGIAWHCGAGVWGMGQHLLVVSYGTHGWYMHRPRNRGSCILSHRLLFFFIFPFSFFPLPGGFFFFPLLYITLDFSRKSLARTVARSASCQHNPPFGSRVVCVPHSRGRGNDRQGGRGIRTSDSLSDDVMV